MKISEIIYHLSKFEETTEDDLKSFINTFEKYIKKESKKYTNIYGLENYKMNKYDYNILYKLYINTKSSKSKLKILLFYMYSVYKIDDIDYGGGNFPIKLFFNFIKKNNNMHKIVLENVINE